LRGVLSQSLYNTRRVCRRELRALSFSALLQSELIVCAVIFNNPVDLLNACLGVLRLSSMQRPVNFFSLLILFYLLLSSVHGPSLTQIMKIVGLRERSKFHAYSRFITLSLALFERKTSNHNLYNPRLITLITLIKNTNY